MRPERSDSPRRKPGKPGSTRGEDRGRTARLEKRGGEFTGVPSLRGLSPEGVGKPKGPQPGTSPVRGRVPKGPRHARETRNPAI